MKTVEGIAIAALIALGMVSTAAQVQGQTPDAAAPSLQDLLKTQYKLSQVGSDSGGFKVLVPGTVVTLKNPAVMATANGSPHAPSKDLFGLCNNTFKGGAINVKKGCATTSIGSKYLPVGDKLYITKFEVKEKANKITFNLVECDTCNRGKSSSMKVEITFEFAPKFLDTAEPGQVTDVVGQIFTPDAGSGGGMASAGSEAGSEAGSASRARLSIIVEQGIAEPAEPAAVEPSRREGIDPT